MPEATQESTVVETTTATEAVVTEVAAALAVEETPVAVSQPEVVPSPAVLTLDDQVEQYMTNGTPQQKGFFETLRSYSLQMRPNYAAVKDERLLQQRQLNAAFIDLLGSYQSKDFGSYWKCVIHYAKKLSAEHGTFRLNNFIKDSYELYQDTKELNRHKSLIYIFCVVVEFDKQEVPKRIKMKLFEDQGFSKEVIRGVQRAYL